MAGCIAAASLCSNSIAEGERLFACASHAPQAGCNAHLAAAAAAAACVAGEDAAAAAQAAFDAAFAAAKEAALEKKEKARSGGSAKEASGEGGQSAKLAAAEGAAASILRQRGAKPAGAAAGGRAAEDEAAARVLEERERQKEAEEEANVPDWMRGEFSWRVRGSWGWVGAGQIDVFILNAISSDACHPAQFCSKSAAPAFHCCHLSAPHRCSLPPSFLCRRKCGRRCGGRRSWRCSCSPCSCWAPGWCAAARPGRPDAAVCCSWWAAVRGMKATAAAVLASGCSCSRCPSCFIPEP